MRYTKAYNWVLDLLRQTSDAVTYDSVARFLDASYRDTVLQNPALGVSLITIGTEDEAYLWESVGYLAASRLIMLPPEEGLQLVRRIKVANLEEVYSVPDLPTLAAMWADRSAAAALNAPLVRTLLVGTIGAPLLPGMVVCANPTQKGTQYLPDTLFGGVYAPLSEEYS